MKNIITILLIVVSTTSLAQNKYKKADRFFDDMRYVLASTEYEKAIDKGDRSMEVLQKAGDAYYFNTNMEGAHKWYDILITEYLEEVNPEYIFRFAHSLEGKGEHKLAKKWMKEFSERSKQRDARANQYSQEVISIEDVLDIESQFILKNLSINTKNSEFGPMYYGKRLIYSSTVDTSYYHTRTYNWNEQPFLNFQLGRISATDADVEHLETFSPEINTKYHEATLAFSPDERKVYFTRNAYSQKLKKLEEGISYLKLYSADLRISLKQDLVWYNIKELPFNGSGYSTGNPTVSVDGKQLYFVSDMPGSIGATDIYVVDILGNNKYSKPRNLGPKINTSGREMFPYISDKKLYFASDGHLGLGGLDVFESNIGDDFETPTNLGAPLNSELDDFGYIVDEATNFGFVCSNRKGGKGDDDIYSFTRYINENNTNKNGNGDNLDDDTICTPSIVGHISNIVTGERIADATVKLFDENGEKIAETQTNLNGHYLFKENLTCNTAYNLKVDKEGFGYNKKSFFTLKGEEETIMPMGLKNDRDTTYRAQENKSLGLSKIKIAIIYFDLNESNIENSASVELNRVVLMMNQYPNMVINIESHTDSRYKDDFNMELSNRRATDARDYLIAQGINPKRILSAIGYGETQLVNGCRNGVTCSEDQHRLNRRSEFIIVKM